MYVPLFLAPKTLTLGLDLVFILISFLRLVGRREVVVVELEDSVCKRE